MVVQFLIDFINFRFFFLNSTQTGKYLSRSHFSSVVSSAGQMWHHEAIDMRFFFFFFFFFFVLFCFVDYLSIYLFISLFLYFFISLFLYFFISLPENLNGEFSKIDLQIPNHSALGNPLSCLFSLSFLSYSLSQFFFFFLIYRKDGKGLLVGATKNVLLFQFVELS